MGDNIFQAPALRSEGAMLPTEQHRAIQEVQAAMVIAKKFPRDQVAAYERIIEACRRPTLAEGALYAYPRGGQTITGPSIRLAEAIAQAWGNLQFGIRELSQSGGESEVEAFAWDIETNTRQVKVFQVPHKRVARGQVKALTDPRDIYEMVANQGARRLRACILGVIPGDVIEAAVRQCEKTMQGNSGKPLHDRIRDMVVYFKDLGVTQSMLEQRLGHKIDATIDVEIVNLKKIYQSLRDGMSKREDWFKTNEPAQDDMADEATNRIKKMVKEKDEAKQGDHIKWNVYSKTSNDPPAVDTTHDPADPADVANWKNMRSGTFGKSGFSLYVYENLLAFQGATDEDYDLALDKWNKLYPGKVCPFYRGEDAKKPPFEDGAETMGIPAAQVAADQEKFEQEPKPEDDMPPEDDDDPEVLRALRFEWRKCTATDQKLAGYALANLAGKGIVHDKDATFNDLSAAECRALIKEFNDLRALDDDDIKY
jgi:hypothetical protein